MEPLRHISITDFGAVIFRRTAPQITQEGGLWDESAKLYTHLGATPREGYHDWTFPKGSRISFKAMEHEQDRFKYDGAQIPLLGFDQLEHFTELQFFYMLSRNRTTCGVMPYVRATANPDPDSWLKEFILWWLDENGEYPDPSRAGVIRWMVRVGDEIYWADKRQQLIDQFDDIDILPLSVTFIPASLEDNPTLMQNDPLYMAKLQALPKVERMRLLKGNWKVKPAAGFYFKREYFPIVDRIPSDVKVVKRVRWWDLASTAERRDGKGRKKNPDYTVGTLMSRTNDNHYFVEHVDRRRESPYGVERAIKRAASIDPQGTTIGLSQDPGQAGVDQIQSYVKKLAGHHVKAKRETGDKEIRCQPFSTQCEFGNVTVVRGAWNETWFDELENFPEVNFDDQIDSSSAAFNFITGALRAGTWGRK
jgi:predicted phage terminase large subunit-like protein